MKGLAGYLFTFLAGLFAAALTPAHAQAAPTSEQSVTPATQPGDTVLCLPAHQSEVAIRLSRAGPLLLVRGVIDGQDIGWLVVDTGASGLSLDPTIVQRLKLPTVGKVEIDAVGGNVAGEMVTCKSFAFADSGVTVQRLIAITMSMRSTESLIGCKLAGLVGGDALGAQPFAIDFRDDTLTFFDRPYFTPPATQPHQLQMFRNLPCVRASMEGREGWFEIDSGAFGSLDVCGAFEVLNRDLFERKPMLPDVAFGGGGRVNHWTIHFSSVQLLGKEFRDVVTSCTLAEMNPNFRDLLSCGSVGTRLLWNSRLTADYPSRKLWAEWRQPDDVDTAATRASDRAKRDFTGQTALMFAAAEKRADVLRSLIKSGADVNAVDKSGFTALMRASAAGSADCARALLDARADAKVQAAIMSLTALHYAAEEGNVEMVKMLLDAGADVNAQTTLKQSPLLRAAQAQAADVVDALLHSGANAATADNQGETPLIAAARGGNDRIVTMLADAKADLDPRDTHGVSALTAAAFERHPSTVKLLLSRGASPNLPYQQAPPLHAAVQANDDQSIAFLLAAGANPRAKDVDGKTAMDLAANNGRIRAMRVLLDHPAATQP